MSRTTNLYPVGGLVYKTGPNGEVTWKDYVRSWKTLPVARKVRAPRKKSVAQNIDEADRLIRELEQMPQPQQPQQQRIAVRIIRNIPVQPEAQPPPPQPVMPVRHGHLRVEHLTAQQRLERAEYERQKKARQRANKKK